MPGSDFKAVENGLNEVAVAAVSLFLTSFYVFKSFHFRFHAERAGCLGNPCVSPGTLQSCQNVRPNGVAFTNAVRHGRGAGKSLKVALLSSASRTRAESQAANGL